MIRTEEREPEIHVPRPILIAAAILIAFAITIAGIARHTGYGQVRIDPVDPSGALASRDLHFRDLATGAIEVRDARSGEVIHLVEPGTNGFIRGSLRGLARERRRRGLDAEVPFRVAVSPNGRTTLEDLATGTTIDLLAFGQDNAAAFATLVLPDPLSLTTHR